ncbi:glycosyltransferase family 25 protein [Aminobacter aganoensis]|uniref:Glycosyl transferase family 25 n=1 Tax=Aminobacter aganoensis TaxID=83264 RepID=A0A7X0FC55_9HYPH|nr:MULTISPECIES: glycosyltransferase family 25 protein [Aminobacter]KQU74212.1 hypothetical protein ASC75_22315 [Aminobacter sp. DSM 101952]MBB6356689.1 glycosyl transferase family 25 [Aminobacter aganoensis]
MKCYLINLDRSPGRLAFMAEQFERLNLSYIRIPAIDGLILGDDVLTVHKMQAAITACFLSHRSAWQAFLHSGEAFAAIVEDDAWLAPAAGHFLAVESWIPAGADIIKLETTGTKAAVANDPIFLGPARSLRRLHSLHEGGACYVVSRAAAARLIEVSEHFVLPLDMFVFGQPVIDDMNVYQMIPAPVRQKSTVETEAVGEFHSTIDLFRFSEPRPRQKRSIRKLRHEFVRPFRQAWALVRRAMKLDDFTKQRIPFG